MEEVNLNDKNKVEKQLRDIFDGKHLGMYDENLDKFVIIKSVVHCYYGNGYIVATFNIEGSSKLVQETFEIKDSKIFEGIKKGFCFYKDDEDNTNLVYFD